MCFKSYCKVLLISCVLIINIATAKTNTKDAIGFPEVEEDESLKNKDNRQPVYLPAMCPLNELYYPGDQKDDWICDCRPAYIYHPKSDACWPAFQRGPCQTGEYLILPLNSVVPICATNPCNVDNYVVWNGKCELLGSTGPCDHFFPKAAALGVNATNLEVGCVRLNLESRFGDDSEPLVQPIPCPPGCKRSINGKCVPK